LWGASAQADDGRARDDTKIAALYPMGKDRSAAASRWAAQNETFDLPGYLSRRGEVSLVGPSGLLQDSARVRLELKPDGDHALSLKVTW
jgi:hypothetical protein